MRGQTVSAAAVAVLVLLAGCSAGAGTGGESFGEAAGVPTGTGAGSAVGAAASGMDGGAAPSVGTGTVSFYLSDRPSAIGDFEHLTVTVSQVEFHYAGPTDAEDEDETGGGTSNDTATGTPENGSTETTDANVTETATATATVTATATATSTPDGNATPANGTANGTETATPADEGADADGASAGWIAFDVDDREADLTELVGPNATLVGDYDLPAGKYTMVRITISGINASLAGTGERVRVKLPSGRLKLNRPFTVGSGDDLDFVFDVSVHRAGNSGKYVLKPVIGESGTDVPIAAVDNATAGDGPPPWAGPQGSDATKPGGPDAASGPTDTGLDAAFQGPVRADGTATIRVHGDRGPLAGATVIVNGSTVGETGDDGRLSFDVPAGDRLVATVTHGNDTVTVETEVAPATGGGPPDDRGEGKQGGKDEAEDGSGDGG